VLILGGAGMLGHRLWRELSPHDETFITIRRSFSVYRDLAFFDEDRTISGIDVTQPQDLHRAFAAARPDVVFNAVGIIKQIREAQDSIASLTINSLLPHQLGTLCAACGARLIHVSTDCVFSGDKGNYSENDFPDARDLYGRTKLLGEVDLPNAITVRTSMIGREIHTRTGLVEWFLSQRGRSVRGYRGAIFTGFTTLELARILAGIARDGEHMHGLWQVSAEPITKYELLQIVNREFNADVSIEPDDEFQCNRSLDSTRFREATGYEPPAWREMIAELAADPTTYDRWRRE
jgi:dTDP-4-dehydrorhamnose reductase